MASIPDLWPEELAAKPAQKSPGAHSPVSGSHVPRVEAGAEHGLAAPGRSALLLHAGSEADLEHCRDALSEEGSPPAAGAQPGRSRSSDRCSPDIRLSQ